MGNAYQADCTFTTKHAKLCCNMQLNLDYLAGFFDGEGNLTMCYDKRIDMTRCRLSIFNTNKEVLDTLKEQYGGFIHTRSHDKPYIKEHWKTSYVLIIQLSKKHLPLLKELHSRCIVKKDKLSLAIEYIETLKTVGAVLNREEMDKAKEKRKSMIGLMNDNRAGTTTERSNG